MVALFDDAKEKPGPTQQRGFPGDSVIKNPPANAGDTRDMGLNSGPGRSPGAGMAIHSSILAWRIPCTEEPEGLQSIVSQRVRHD